LGGAGFEEWTKAPIVIAKQARLLEPNVEIEVGVAGPRCSIGVDGIAQELTRWLCPTICGGLVHSGSERVLGARVEDAKALEDPAQSVREVGLFTSENEAAFEKQFEPVLQSSCRNLCVVKGPWQSLSVHRFE
ncbi:MAG: hypothetical protein ACREL4_03550, partial [Gemmatimonadales bacterium]